MVNAGYTIGERGSGFLQSGGWASRALDATATVLSFGTNKLVSRGSGWLRRHGLTRYVVPLLLANEAFGAYRVYLAGGVGGWW